MASLSEKVANCYKYYLTRLSYGITNQDYCLLYWAILTLKNNITDNKYIQYFYNNLVCPTSGGISFPQNDETFDVISWTLNPSDTLSPDFVYISTRASIAGTYIIRTTSTIGYNFLYITVPVSRNVKIYDEMSDLIFDSSGTGSYEFEYVGEIITGNNRSNAVYRKSNVYNTYNPVTYYVKIF